MNEKMPLPYFVPIRPNIEVLLTQLLLQEHTLKQALEKVSVEKCSWS
jgi:hypothetical protein